MFRVMITSTGFYLILALVLIVVIGVGVFVAYRMSNQPDK